MVKSIEARLTDWPTVIKGILENCRVPQRCNGSAADFDDVSWLYGVPLNSPLCLESKGSRYVSHANKPARPIHSAGDLAYWHRANRSEQMYFYPTIVMGWEAAGFGAKARRSDGGLRASWGVNRVARSLLVWVSLVRLVVSSEVH